MESKNCINEFCCATTSSEWKKGWTLKSGGFATLCFNCGTAYENSLFCETFHVEESGWRDCKICRKRLHCGCIASRHLHEYMDFGGVGCISCAKRLEIHQAPQIKISSNIPTNGTLVTNGVKDVHSTDKINGDKLSTEKLLQLTKTLGINDVGSTLEQLNKEDPAFKTLESGKRATSLTPQQSLSKSDSGRTKAKEEHQSFAQPSLNFTLISPLGVSSPVSPFPLGNIEGSEHSKSSLQQGQRTRPSLQKPPKPSPTIGSDSTNKGSSSQTRVARPPVDGRGRNLLLPRYWPKITDQELQQLSGDLNSTIVPLFEKILSASDAGRIGRLVLPKACAEAYFPTVNQSEGIPIKIQDIKGKEWTFQFRFWPNNNSRMYVLEGVTPCIQNMQLQAGDTVIFSRRDPGGQLVIGCRKSSNNDTQDPQTPASANNGSLAETPFSGANDNRPKTSKTSDDSLHHYMSASDKRKAKNIKNKRLHMHIDDAMELRITWEEAQELLRPSPSSEPTIVLVENHEFEEFEEPPVFGKKTIFISRPSGEHEQLAQCDSCLKWRRLPVHALLSANWTCSENIWDSSRYTCSTPEDINPRDLESFFKDSKKRRISDKKTSASREGEPSGLDALATAAALGDNGAMTTRHPRHRTGCSCIVCIQPPSGKGKHEPACKCNVCLTVRRRFKTLMLRKKKKISEREQEVRDLAYGEDNNNVLNESDASAMNSNVDDSDDKGRLDLNSDPHREDDVVVAGDDRLPCVGEQQPCLVSENVVASSGDNAVKEDALVLGGDGEQENQGEDG